MPPIHHPTSLVNAVFVGIKMAEKLLTCSNKLIRTPAPECASLCTPLSNSVTAPYSTIYLVSKTGLESRSTAKETTYKN
jgi:hypothetical protein